MATFTVKTQGSGPETNLDFTIQIPDAAGREYTTVVNAGIAKVVAAAGAILIGAENDHDLGKALSEGMAMVNKIGD